MKTDYKRRRSVTVRVSEAEHARLEAEAIKEAGTARRVSDYVRAALDAFPIVRELERRVTDLEGRIICLETSKSPDRE